jgi:hypothetical protein
MKKWETRTKLKSIASLLNEITKDFISVKSKVLS